MNVSELIGKLNKEINEYLESGSREDKACAEGLRMARTYIQQEALKRKILTRNQQIVLEWLKEEQTKNPELTIFGTLSVLFDESENRFMSLDVIDALNDLSNSQQAGVFQGFSQWALEQEEE